MFNFDNSQQGGQALPTTRKHQRLVITEGIQADDFFRTDQETQLTPQGGILVTEVHGAHLLQCGHTILEPGALGAPCQCGKTLCMGCSSVRCVRCLEIFCSTCFCIYEDAPHCRPCRKKKRIKFALLWMVEGFHKLLSKEF